MTQNATRKSYRTPSAHPAGLAETKYVLARREWDARTGATIVQTANWRYGCLILAALLATSTVGNIVLGRQPKAVLHVVEVDAHGDVAYRGPAGDAPYAPNEAVVRFQLRRFIELTRTISSDNVLLRKNWFDAYKLLTLKGNALMTEWIGPKGGANDPFQRAQTMTTSTEIISAIPLSATSWQIDWWERTWDKSGQSIGRPVAWRATLTTVLIPPTTRQQMMDNPLGLFVDEFHWDIKGDKS